MARPDPARMFRQGNYMAEHGRPAEAVEMFRQAAALAPGSAEIQFNLGNALIACGRAFEAAEAYLACLRLQPGIGGAWLNLAETMRGFGALDDARSMAEQALLRLPGDHRALLCMGNVLHDGGDFAGAAAQYRRALLLAPTHAGLHGNLGNALHALGDLPAALASHDQAVALAPEEPELRFGRATALLATGDLARGFAEFDWRFRRPAHPPRQPTPPWAGEDIAGRTILLQSEQGLGDTLQFLRFVPAVAARGARVVLQVQTPLTRLCQGLPGVDLLLGDDEAAPAFDLHCPLMSLPRALGIAALDQVPAPPSYLAADPTLAAEWAARLAPRDGRLRVGLVWAGGARGHDGMAWLVDRRRSVALATLAPLAGVPGVGFVSLQRDEASAQAVDPPAGLDLIDPMAEVRDFADTAAIIAGLDLVISVDTAVAHLAGALGTPVWLLSRFDACWRWLRDRDDSPWYPSMRLFRQDRPGDWAGPVGRMATALARLKGPPETPALVAAAAG